MAIPTPPHMLAAKQQLEEALKSAEKKDVDLSKISWNELEQALIKLFGGPFRIEQPEHQALALGVASVFGDRLGAEFNAFWFPNRDTPEGVALGFPDALMMLAPFQAVLESLRQAKLEKLDEVIADIRRAVAQVRFAPNAGAAPKLGAADYVRLFDPGFIQLIVVDPAKVKSTLESTPDKLVRELRDAISRTPQSQLPPEAKQQFEAQIVGTLQRMPQELPVIATAELSPRLPELIAHLFATKSATGAAPEEFWVEVAMPLLHIGAPTQFPPIDPDELEAFKQGADPLALFLDVVPHQFPSPDDGLLGAFRPEDVQLMHEGFEKVGRLRLAKVSRDRLKPMLDAFDPAKTREALAKFTAHVEQAAGGHKAGENREASQILDASLTLLGDLKKAFAEQGDLCFRRITEAEAASEAALALVRRSLQGPRIILTT